MNDVILLAAVAVPILLLLVLRANAAVVFLSLCAGSILVKYTGENAAIAVSSFALGNRTILDSAAKIGVLLLPVIVTMLLQRKSVSGGKLIINLLSSLAVGVVGVLLVVPLLTPGTRYAMMDTKSWELLISFQDAVVAVGVFLSLFVLWMTKPKNKHHSKKH